MRETMTPAEAARALGVGLQYVYGLLVTGKLRGAKLDGHWQIEASAVRQRIAEMENRRGTATIER